MRTIIREVNETTQRLTREDGSEFNLNTVQGTDWTRDRLDRLAAAVQAEHDIVIKLSRLPDDDPDKTATAQELRDEYGGRVFLRGDSIIHRSTIITFSLVSGQLTPHHEEVR